MSISHAHLFFNEFEAFFKKSVEKTAGDIKNAEKCNIASGLFYLSFY